MSLRVQSSTASGSKEPIEFTTTLDFTNAVDASWGSWSEKTQGLLTYPASVSDTGMLDLMLDYYPCMLKDGVEGVKLNPNDYSKDLEGNDVDITTGADGDVMICFAGIKNLWWKLEKSTDGDSLTIRLAFASAKPEGDWRHLTYNGRNVDKLYVSAYFATNSGGAITSLSGKSFYDGTGIGALKSDNMSSTIISAKGAGYDAVYVDVWTILEMILITKYRGNFRGFYPDTVTVSLVDNAGQGISTGGGNTMGLNYANGTVYTSQSHIKFLGIENLWVNTTLEGLEWNAAVSPTIAYIYDGPDTKAAMIADPANQISGTFGGGNVYNILGDQRYGFLYHATAGTKAKNLGIASWYNPSAKTLKPRVAYSSYNRRTGYGTNGYFSMFCGYPYLDQMSFIRFCYYKTT